VTRKPPAVRGSSSNQIRPSGPIVTVESSLIRGDTARLQEPVHIRQSLHRPGRADEATKLTEELHLLRGDAPRPDAPHLRCRSAAGSRPVAIAVHYQAMIEVGRAQRTIFVARYLRDRDLQREINEGLNVVESWNRANSVIFFGKGGDIATNRRDEQELSVLCLRVLLWLAVAPSRPAAVGTALAQHEEIVFAAATTGPTNIMATVVCPDMAALYRYLTERVGVLDGVERVETAPLLRHVKQVGAVLP